MVVLSIGSNRLLPKMKTDQENGGGGIASETPRRFLIEHEVGKKMVMYGAGEYLNRLKPVFVASPYRHWETSIQTLSLFFF